jgi:hypothetical protein
LELLGNTASQCELFVRGWVGIIQQPSAFAVGMAREKSKIPLAYTQASWVPSNFLIVFGNVSMNSCMPIIWQEKTRFTIAAQT